MKYSRVYSMLLIVAILVIAANARAQTDTELRKAFDNLLPGTSIDKVREQVGSPTRIEPFKLYNKSTADTTICWYYGFNDWTLFFTNKYLNRIEKSRDKMLIKLQEWANPNNPEGIVIIYGK